MLHLKGVTDHQMPEILSTTIPVAVQTAQIIYQEEAFGFCTQFMIKDHKLDIDLIRTSLENMGKCLIVVGDSSSVRIHIHALEPAKVIEKARIFGTVFDIDVRNMDEQHEEFVIINQEKAINLHASVVAVVNGDGMLKVFSDLNVSAIVPGGQTMNPSTLDILQAVDGVPSDKVLVLPNNKNIIPTAKLVQTLTKKTVKVVPTETIPQGIASMISFIPENDMDTNFEAMSGAIGTVKTIEITRATRDTKVNKLKIKAGDVIGLVDGDLLASGNSPEEVIFSIFEGLNLDNAELISIYFGKGIEQADADKISSRIAALKPGIDIGTVSGGFPNYSYIISVE